MGLERGLTQYGDEGFSRFLRRSFAKGLGLTTDSLERPIIGITNTYSDISSCHSGVPALIQAVKRGVLLSGGIPVEFPTITLPEPFLSPTSMLLRNLMAMDTEEMLRGLPVDGAVLIGGCDKTLPAQIMAMASADVPAVVVPTGPMASGQHAGETLGACTDCRRIWARHRAGQLTERQLNDYEDALVPTAGTCTVMGTASSMAAIGEALGVILPGGAALPAPSAARLRYAENAGRRIVAMVREDLRPSAILTPAAIRNAVRVLAAIGGSTNAVIHLIAIAGRTGHPLTLADVDRISRETPLLVDIKPTGQYQMEDLYRAGGIPRVLKELEPLLELDALMATGRSLGTELASLATEEWVDRRVIRSLEAPLRSDGGLAVLRGNLAPDGAIIKQHAASPGLLRHTGPAVVFTSLEDLATRIDDVSVTPDSVLVLQGGGPIGAPGMPEVGMLPIPRRLLEQGVRDVVRISDARMSGTAFGTVVLHVAPEAAAGGTLGLVRDGDMIALDVEQRRLDLLVSDDELRLRASTSPRSRPTAARGYLRLFLDHVLQANEGCDFDFLQGSQGQIGGSSVTPRRAGQAAG